MSVQYVSTRVWVLQRGGGSSSGCYCGHAGSLWRSNWAASLANPSLCLLFFSCLHLHLSSRNFCDAAEGSSSFPSSPLYSAAHPLGRLDYVREVWIHLLYSLYRSLNPCAMPFLACSPSQTHRCNHAGSPVWEERRLCIHECCEGDRHQSGLYSHWIGWILVDHLWLCHYYQALGVRKNWVHAG